MGDWAWGKYISDREAAAYRQAIANERIAQRNLDAARAEILRGEIMQNRLTNVDADEVIRQYQAGSITVNQMRDLLSQGREPAKELGFTESTLFKVYNTLKMQGLDDRQAQDCINALQNDGILFREMIPTAGPYRPAKSYSQDAVITDADGYRSRGIPFNDNK